jgi:hypothetical protein
VAPRRICLFCQEPLAECICDDDGTDIARPAPLAARDVQAPRCPHCLDNGMVCESHPLYPFGVTVEGHRSACGAGMPCPACCSPVPADGTHSIAEAFTPDWLRGGSG